MHAHWLAAGAVAATLGRPFVVQVWGTDVELARTSAVACAARSSGGRGFVIGASALPRGARTRTRGAGEYAWCRAGVEIPDAVGEPDEPPHVLYAGRLSAEKGIEDFLEATEGIAAR